MSLFWCEAGKKTICHELKINIAENCHIRIVRHELPATVNSKHIVCLPASPHTFFTLTPTHRQFETGANNWNKSSNYKQQENHNSPFTVYTHNTYERLVMCLQYLYMRTQWQAMSSWQNNKVCVHIKHCRCENKQTNAWKKNKTSNLTCNLNKQETFSASFCHSHLSHHIMYFNINKTNKKIFHTFETFKTDRQISTLNIQFD